MTVFVRPRGFIFAPIVASTHVVAHFMRKCKIRYTACPRSAECVILKLPGNLCHDVRITTISLVRLTSVVTPVRD